LLAENGLTKPGAYLYELLGRCGITPSTWSILHDCLDRGMSILTEEAVDMGRK